MTENLELYEPTDIEIEKGIRYLRSMGLPNIGITIQGDVYNKVTDKYSSERKQYIFNLNGKPVGFSKIALLKNAFKFDLIDPSTFLEIKDKDIVNDISLTWDFWHNQKNYLLTDFTNKTIQNAVKKLPKNIVMSLRFNSLGLYNIKTEKYYTINANSYTSVAYSHNNKKVKIVLNTKPMFDELNKMQSKHAPFVNNIKIEKEIKQDTKIVQHETLENKEPEHISDFKEDSKKMLKDIKTQSNSENVVTKLDKLTVLEFINDVLTLDLDELSKKYKVSKEILRTIKK